MRTFFVMCALVLVVGTARAAPIESASRTTETAKLDQHVEAHFDVGDESMVLAADGQTILADRFEVGLNVPVLVSDYDSTNFGNVTLNLKAGLIGESLAAYANTTLPTASGIDDRSFTVINAGLAGSTDIGQIELGASTGAQILLAKAGHAGAYVLDVYGAYRLHRMAAFQLAVQNSISEDGYGMSLTPAIELSPTDNVRVSAGGRIDVKDAGGHSALMNLSYSW